jgi:hypothetical protein
VIQLGVEPRTLPQSGMLYLQFSNSRIKDFDFLLLMNFSLAIAFFFEKYGSE